MSGSSGDARPRRRRSPPRSPLRSCSTSAGARPRRPRRPVVSTEQGVAPLMIHPWAAAPVRSPGDSRCDAVSHVVFARYEPVVTTTKCRLSGAMSTSRAYRCRTPWYTSSRIDRCSVGDGRGHRGGLMLRSGEQTADGTEVAVSTMRLPSGDRSILRTLRRRSAERILHGDHQAQRHRAGLRAEARRAPTGHALDIREGPSDIQGATGPLMSLMTPLLSLAVNNGSGVPSTTLNGDTTLGDPVDLGERSTDEEPLPVGAEHHRLPDNTVHGWCERGHQAICRSRKISTAGESRRPSPAEVLRRRECSPAATGSLTT